MDIVYLGMAKLMILTIHGLGRCCSQTKQCM